MKYNICGKVLKPHGLKGEVKVLNSSDFNRFSKSKIVYYLEDDKYMPLTIKTVKQQTPLIVSFVGFEDIDSIMFLVNRDLYALREDNDLGPDEYYYSDLIGKDIYNEDGINRGKVNDIRDYPQGKYLVLDNKKLIPFNGYFIIDVLEDKIIIHEIEGLL